MKLTNYSSTEGIVWISWGRHRCDATRTPRSILDPTLSRSTIWHIVEHSPKLRTLPRIRATTTERLEEKHYQVLNNVYSCTTIFSFSIFLSLKIARNYTSVKVFLLPDEPQPKLYCVTTHLIDIVMVKSLSSPGICCPRPAAAFVPPANRFHPRILANICHLALHQGFSVRYWNLAFWFNFKITDKNNLSCLLIPDKDNFIEYLVDVVSSLGMK